MNIDKLYDVAEILQNQHDDMELGEILDVVLQGSCIRVSYDKTTKYYNISEKHYNYIVD